MQHLNKAQVLQVAIQRRRWALAGFLNRMHREFHWNAPSLTDARLDAVHQEHMDLVAGHKV